ncbi:hypothetical protein H8356DRAFT_1295041 [Neocallimastix lanati (nom. inval.)]|uniref:Uncharacterized protein n=1 Tax=Neocallimastix californiae TaxID=1754190 RepID=A0A1Y2DLW8_9FUNG|nr:hypothetical protein H8356DRAFT_1295041 [Neocallimastix sp. JGI-2020a]ORY60298.1 hypothetical protein LY90DRAFT_505813 [Neocallimastix californiae]|eukprot:ORY60298.1 hypothetical protein LY90DRAFT_505813 [Neocallimastix californiae]
MESAPVAKSVISNEEYKKIPVAYVIISFIIPGLKIDPERIKQIIEEIAKITKFKSDELLEFVKSEVSIVSREENKFFVKMNIETQYLIGLSSLDDKDKLSKLIDFHIEKALPYLSEKRERFEGIREEKLKLIENELNIRIFRNTK